MAATVYDHQAEQAIAAAAAFSQTAALACTDRLRREHFADPRCWQIIEAALAVPDPKDDAPVSSQLDHESEAEWWREDEIARQAGVPPLVLRGWCQEAPAAWDASGRLADRVVAAAANRARAHQLLQELEVLGFEIEWEAARV